MKLKEIPRLLWAKHPFRSFIVIGCIIPAVALFASILGGWFPLAIAACALFLSSLLVVHLRTTLLPYIAKALIGTPFLNPLLNSLEDEDRLDVIALVNSKKEPIFISKLLNSKKLTAEQKIALLSSKTKAPFYDKNIFTHYFSPTKIVSTILNTKALSSEQKTNLFNLLDNEGNNSLADYNSDANLVQILDTDELSAEQKMRLISHKNNKGQTFLHVDYKNIKIRALLNTSKLSSEEKTTLFNITDDRGATWLNGLVKYGRRDPQKEMCLQEILMTKQLSIAQKMKLLHDSKILLEMAYDEKGGFMFFALRLLNIAGFSIEQKMTLLTDTAQDGETPLLRSCEMGYLKTATDILNSVPAEYRSRLLSYTNPKTGEHVNIIDDVYPDPKKVAFLQQFGASFGERITQFDNLRKEGHQKKPKLSP
jgi:hypothetical protein